MRARSSVSTPMTNNNHDDSSRRTSMASATEPSSSGDTRRRKGKNKKNKSSRTKEIVLGGVPMMIIIGILLLMYLIYSFQKKQQQERQHYDVLSSFLRKGAAATTKINNNNNKNGILLVHKSDDDDDYGDDDDNLIILDLLETKNLLLDTNGAERKPQSSKHQIKIRLYTNETPDSTRYINEVIQLLEEDNKNKNNNHTITVTSKIQSKCNFYRAEPVPEYWGNTSYPDTYFGGRWGPPYSLLQGQILLQKISNKTIKPAKAENHKPIIKRGMVAWAGGGGSPAFFIALADHPEWGHGHTVFGYVKSSSSSLDLIDSIVQNQPKTIIKRKQPPDISNLVTPIKFTLSKKKKKKIKITTT